jgi:RNA polymerase sigma-70 factor (ECF subfamily)
LGNEADAEEVTQDAFMKVFHGIEKFEGKSTFRTWLFRIVNNECASRYRRRKRREEGRRAYLVDDDRRRSTEPPEVEGGGLGGPIGAAMATLTESDREVLLLRHLADLPIQEIADAVGIGLSAAKMRLYRAEERLREAYGRLSGRPDV